MPGPDRRGGLSRVVAIPVAADVVWSVLADLERWPTWTASMTTVKPLGEGPIGVGSRFLVKQPRLAEMTWTVTEWDEGHGFVWQSRTVGVTSVATHWVRGDGADASVELSLVQSGPLSSLVWLLGRRTMERYLDMEAEGLRRRVLGG